MAGRKLKFPILDNIEYLDISKNKRTILSLKGSDVNGKTWRQLQQLLGEKIGLDVFRYSIKIKTDATIHGGTVRSVLSSAQMKEDSKVEQNGLEKQVLELSEKISGMKSDPNTDLLIQVIKEGHNNTVQMLRDKIQEQSNFITRLELKIENQEKELTDQDSIIDELKKQTGTAQYFKFAVDFLKDKMKDSKPLADNAVSDAGDIPKDIIKILGVVNWIEVDEEILKEIVTYLGIFIQKLPMKG